MYHKVIGIDLGTTYCAASVWEYDRKEVIVIPSAMGENTMPSVVGLDDDRRVIVGRPAQQRRLFDPANTIIEIKRDMGVYDREPNPGGATEEEKRGTPRMVRFRDEDYSPQKISAFILTELKRQAETFIGEEIHDAVITVPAYFKEPQKGATRDAAELARFNVKQLLNEPTAAAVSFGADQVDDRQSHIYAVYDLGGGTFDVSIIEVGGDNVSIIGTGGDPRLGGGDFDDLITEWVLGQIRKEHGVDLSNDASIRARIKLEVEQRKRELSAANSAMINLPFLTADLSVNMTISRGVFDNLIAPLVKKSLDCLDEAIESAQNTRGISREDIEQVLLVGGSTRIPRIRTVLAEHMEHLEEMDIRTDINPDEAVSRGAAMVARKHNPSEGFEGQEIDLIGTGQISQEDAAEAQQLVLQDVTSHTLGILVNESNFHPILAKDSRIPAEQTEAGFVNAGPSKSVDVLIFQGEEPIAFNNTNIGRLPIPLPEPKERGYWKFEVTFVLDHNGLLHVTIKRLNDDEVFTVDVQCDVRSRRGDLERDSKHLQDVMASGDLAAGEEAGSGPGVPPPPASGPAAATAKDAKQVHADAPPPEAPAEFKSIARRSFKLLQHPLAEDKHEKLQSAYSAFVEAVKSGADNIEDLGDELGDVYLECKQA